MLICLGLEIYIELKAFYVYLSFHTSTLKGRDSELSIPISGHLNLGLAP